MNTTESLPQINLESLGLGKPHATYTHTDGTVFNVDVLPEIKPATGPVIAANELSDLPKGGFTTLQENEDGTGAIIMAKVTKPAPIRVMVDLETWGTAPGSALISIGAVIFNDTEIVARFYERIDCESCLRAGLKIDFSTIQWWLEQSEEARLEAIKKDGKSLKEVCSLFAEWVKQHSWVRFEDDKEVELWGNGASFDNSILGAAYDACGIPSPWQRDRGNRCYRTMKAMYPHIKMTKRVGTHHNALDDAESQALHLIEILQHKQGQEGYAPWSKECGQKVTMLQAELATVKGELERHVKKWEYVIGEHGQEDNDCMCQLCVKARIFRVRNLTGQDDPNQPGLLQEEGWAEKIKNYIPKPQA